MAKLTSDTKILAAGKRCLNIEAEALSRSSELLDEEFVEAAKLISGVKGKVILTGLGKSGHIATKIAATLSSTGTTAVFLHPSEALHGDLGIIDRNDGVIAVAQGGETEEVISVVSYARRLELPVVAITGKSDSRLAKLANRVVSSSIDREACPLNLAPTTSSTLAMALGDALAVALMELKEFEMTDFAAFHPGGSLGRQLKRVEEFVVTGDRFGKTKKSATIAEVAACLSASNFGIVGVVGATGEIEGVITDGDIRRAVEKYSSSVSSIRANEMMSSSPISIPSSDLAIEAINLMEKRKVTTLLVRSEQKDSKIIGIIRLHDLIEAKIY